MDTPKQSQNHRLVGGWATPLKNMTSSIGMMTATQYFWEKFKIDGNHSPTTSRVISGLLCIIGPHRLMFAAGTYEWTHWGATMAIFNPANHKGNPFETPQRNVPNPPRPSPRCWSFHHHLECPNPAWRPTEECAGIHCDSCFRPCFLKTMF